jgi:hypothetical protein
MGYVLPCKALIQTLGSSHYLSQTHTHTHTHTLMHKILSLILILLLVDTKGPNFYGTLIDTSCIWKLVNARLQGSGVRNCSIPLRIPKSPHPLSYGDHHGNICVHHCSNADRPQLLNPTGDPSRPVWLQIKSQSHSKFSENLWAFEHIPGEIIKVTLTWVAYGTAVCH